MLPDTLTVKERIIYSMLPYGYGNNISIQNALRPLANSSIMFHISTLLTKEMIAIRTFTLKDNKSRKHQYTYYALTSKGIATYFPALAKKVPSIKVWMELHGNLQVSLLFPSRNGAVKDRMFRAVEAEQFCSNLGIHTTMDHRPILLDTVFGCSRNSVLDQVTTGLGLCEAVMKVTERNAKQRDLILRSREAEIDGEAAKPMSNDNGSEAVSDFCFYHAREIAGSIEGSQDMSIMTSPYIGLLASNARAIMVYQTARFGGIGWNEKSESKARLQSLQFCRCIENNNHPMYRPIEEAVLFYQSPRELVHTLQGVGLRTQLRYDNLFAPYSYVYAIPYSNAGLKILHDILSDKNFYRNEIDRCLDYGGIMADEIGDEQSLYQIRYYDVKTVCATPLNLRMLANFISLPMEERIGQFLTYPVYESVLNRLLRDTDVLIIPQKK